MISNLNYLADQFVFYNLKKIRYGYLQIIDSKGKEYFFGDNKSNLKAKLKINSPSFSSKLLRNGSSSLGESYINNEFETEDLSSLIELSARNINITYKISGFFKFSIFTAYKIISSDEAGLSSDILYVSPDLKFDKDLNKMFAISSTCTLEKR